jgi:iron complex outermembrane receptor protein
MLRSSCSRPALPRLRTPGSAALALLALWLAAPPLARAAPTPQAAEPAQGTPAPARDASGPAPASAARTDDEIVVTASPLGRASDELALPITLLERNELIDAGGATLGDVLRSQVGLTTTSFAAGASRPVIRGQDADRVKVLENGQGTGDVSTLSADHGVPINPLAVQRLEIVRGPAALRYGGGAIGGVVNALTRRIPSERSGSALGGQLLSAYGFAAAERNLATVLEGDLGSFSWHADALAVRARDYDIPGRLQRSDRQDNSFSRSVSTAAGGAWIGEGWRAGASLSRYRSDYGIPAPEDPAAPPFISLEQDRYEFELDVTPQGEWIEALRLRGGRSDYLHHEIIDEQASDTKPSGAVFANEEHELRAELVHRPLAGWTGALGLQFGARDFEAGGEGGELLPPADGENYALYLFESRELAPNLQLDLAGRLDRIELSGSSCPVEGRACLTLPGSEEPQQRDFRRRFRPHSASAALLYSFADSWSLGLTLTRAQRAPEPFELFSQGPHDATETFEFGDPRARAETSHTADLQLRGTWGRLSAELSGFHTDYRRFTYGRLTGTSRNEDGDLLDDLSGELRDLVYTQDDARFSGGELLLRWDWFELGEGRIGVELQGDYVRARLSGENAPRIPPLRWGGALTYQSDNMTARLGLLHSEAQTQVAPFETRTSGYSELGASFRVRIAGSRERPLDLTITARNLLDERQRNAVSFKKDGTLLPGRDVRVGMQLRF